MPSGVYLTMKVVFTTSDGNLMMTWEHQGSWPCRPQWLNLVCDRRCAKPGDMFSFWFLWIRNLSGPWTSLNGQKSISIHSLRKTSSLAPRHRGRVKHLQINNKLGQWPPRQNIDSNLAPLVLANGHLGSAQVRWVGRSHSMIAACYHHSPVSKKGATCECRR